MIIETKGVKKKFFGLTALDNVSLGIRQGEILGLIGPNGAGKSTLFNCITGFLRPDGGRIFFKGEEITKFSPHQIALRGVTRTFQLVRNFGYMTVLENMLMAVQEHQERNLFLRFIRAPSIKKREKKAIKKAKFLLEFMGISHLMNERASSLSYGQQKILSMAQALMPDPEILLLDEPTSAVNPTLINQIQHHLIELNKKGQTIFLIEHNMNVVMNLCQRIVVLYEGRVIAEGEPEEIQNNREVIDAYFGT